MNHFTKFIVGSLLVVMFCTGAFAMYEWLRPNPPNPVQQSSLPDLPAIDVGRSPWEIARVQWLSSLKAKAERGDANARVTLGGAYEYGYGSLLKRNSTEAVNLYRAAAQGGDIAGQIDLAGMYERGEGVKHDWAEAYFWNCVAEVCPPASELHPKPAFKTIGHIGGLSELRAVGRASLGAFEDQKRLTSQQVAQENVRVLEWRKSHPALTSDQSP
jgi:hypothetical protein